MQNADIILLRSLLEATRDIERLLERSGVEIVTIVFLRNDVYEVLVDATPDRGKESKVVLDWTDPDLLKEMLRRRLVYNNLPSETTFDEAWHRICTSHIRGEETATYLIERSLMRPRNLLNLVNYCKSNAVNLGHEKIMVPDIDKAVTLYSADLGNEISLEIRDVFPDAEDILYTFIDSAPRLILADLHRRFDELRIASERRRSLLEILLWFAFLGVVRTDVAEPVEVYCHDVFYDMKKLLHYARNFNDEAIMFSIHRAFWPFLGIAGRE